MSFECLSDVLNQHLRFMTDSEMTRGLLLDVLTMYLMYGVQEGEIPSYASSDFLRSDYQLDPLFLKKFYYVTSENE